MKRSSAFCLQRSSGQTERRVFVKHRLVITIAIAALAAGCATVQPWEREGLADPIMEFDENPIDAGVKEHHIDYREGSSGATGAQAGGCGCG